MPRTFKVIEELSADELEELRAFTRARHRTVDECHEWIQAHGYTMHRSAVGTWKQDDEDQQTAERFHRSRGTVTAIMAAYKETGSVGISDASQLQLSQVLFERILQIDAAGEAESGDLLKLAMALKTNVGTKQGIERLREEMAAKQKEAVDEAAKVATAGGSGEAVVARMRAVLGV